MAAVPPLQCKRPHESFCFHLLHVQVQHVDSVASQLLAEARHYAGGVSAARSKLMPYRDSILVFRAKRTSYETIASILKRHGVPIQASTVGYFVRRYCPRAEIERVRRELMASSDAHRHNPPPVTVTSTPPGKGRPARIARDDL